MYIFHIAWYDSYDIGLGAAIVRANNVYEAVTQLPVWEKVLKEAAQDAFGEETGPLTVDIDWLKEAAAEIELDFTIEDVTEQVLKMVEPLILAKTYQHLVQLHNLPTSSPDNGAAPV